MLTYVCVVTITRPPENTTVCRDTRVIISCGYQCSDALPFIWIINGMPFTEDDIMDNPMYRLNNPTTPNAFSLSLYYINHTTTFQCRVQSTTSRHGTVTVAAGTYVHTYIHTLYVHNVL